MSHLKEYGNATGPFGFPMSDDAARELDKIVAENSKDSVLEYQRKEIPKATKYFIDNEKESHIDVSVATDSSVDLDKEIVDPNGVKWDHYDKRRTVTLGHNYRLPPVGKCLWWKRGKEEWLVKTQYAPRPKEHPEQSEWVPDTVFHLIKEGYMGGKSIGFLPLKGHVPTREEFSKDIHLKGVEYVYDESLIFEYAACTVQANTNAIAIEVSKGFSLPEELTNQLKDFETILASLKNEEQEQERKNKKPEIPRGIKGLTLEDYEKGLETKVTNFIENLKSRVPQIVENSIDTMRGKV